VRYVIGALTGSYFTSYTLSATASTTSVLALRPGVAVTDHVPTVRFLPPSVALFFFSSARHICFLYRLFRPSL
jgi:hypothetical protein